MVGGAAVEDTQLLKGILEGCVLAIIEEGETYGYDILSKLEEYGFEDIIEGTLYPVLTRLNNKGLISSRIGISPLGPKRKYFSITEEGINWIKNFRESYKKITRQAHKILFE